MLQMLLLLGLCKAAAMTVNTAGARVMHVADASTARSVYKAATMTVNTAGASYYIADAFTARSVYKAATKTVNTAAAKT